MANTDAAFGAKPVRHLTGGTIRANEWKIIGDGTSSSNIFTGDFVKLGATGYIDVAAAGNRILGVFAGCSYTNSSGEQVFSKYYPASTTTQNSSDITAVSELVKNAYDADANLVELTFCDSNNIGGFNEWKNIDLVKLLCQQMDEKLGNSVGTSERLITYIKEKMKHYFYF